jgi:hypothetical protein
MKRIIRESEAISGIETLGLDSCTARFLDLPFYPHREGARRSRSVPRMWRS